MKNHFRKGANLFLVLFVVLGTSVGPLQKVAVAGTNQPLRSDMANKLKSNASSSDKNYVPNEVLVKFVNSVDLKKNEGQNQANQLAQQKKLQKKTDLRESNSIVFEIKDGKTVQQKIKEMQSDPKVLRVQPNFKYKKSADPSDSNFTSQWGLKNTGQAVGGVTGAAGADISAVAAWDISQGLGALVAVVDDGVAYNNQELQANMWDGGSCVDENNVAISGGCVHGYEYDDYAGNDNDPLPSVDGNNSHGTHIAGIIAAAINGSGTVGVAPQAKIMAVKSANLETSELVKAIAFAKNNGAKIINASWGGYFEDLEIRDAISSFPGLFVTAAGNDASDNDYYEDSGTYPCNDNLDNIICVAATDQNDELASFSNYGVSSVDVAAPGVNVLSTVATEEVYAQNFNSGLPAGWAISGNAAIANGVLIGDTNVNPYLSSEMNVVQSAPIDLSGITTNNEMQFTATCDTEYLLGSFSGQDDWADYMQVDLSSDGGASWVNDFIRIDEALIDQDGDPTGAATRIISGLSINSDFLTNNFEVRFKWISNSFDNDHAGCTIDDLSIKKMGDGSGNQVGYMNGTSMAAPHVAGLAALVYATYPSLSANAIKIAVLDNGDSLASLQDLTVSGKRINAASTLTYLASSKDIVDANLNSLNSGAEISLGSNTVNMTVPFGTDIGNLSPVFDHNGASISPASGSAQNFTNPVIYTVTAQDDSTKQYTVTVDVAPYSAKQITAFEFSELGSVGVIDENEHTIGISVPFGTNISSLSPDIWFMGASVGPTGTMVDFTNPVVYTVTAADGTTQEYVVTVTVSADSFSNVKVKLSGSDVSDGKSNSTSVKLKFDNSENAKQYMLSKSKNFSESSWKNYTGDSIKVTLKKKSGKQRFYVKFRDSYGMESGIYSKAVTYVSPAREIKNSKSSVRFGESLIQRGNKFSKNSQVQLFFSRAGGGYYKPQTVKTDGNGKFIIPYVVKKAPGKYSWYAVDVKTQKKSKTISYTVKK